MAESWSTQLEVVATPPAVGIDLTLPGGIYLGMGYMYGRDSGARKSREGDFLLAQAVRCHQVHLPTSLLLHEVTWEVHLPDRRLRQRLTPLRQLTSTKVEVTSGKD
jgi:hypothetical protein